MATTYIVSGHLGGMYLSQGNPDDIQEFCEQCGDCDWIVGEFDTEDAVGDIANKAVLCYANNWMFLPEEADLKEYSYTLPELQDMWEEVEEAFSEKELSEWFENMKFADDVTAYVLAHRNDYISEYSFIKEAM